LHVRRQHALARCRGVDDCLRAMAPRAVHARTRRQIATVAQLGAAFDHLADLLVPPGREWICQRGVAIVLLEQPPGGIPALAKKWARAAIGRQLRAGADARVQRPYADLARTERGSRLFHEPHLTWRHERDGNRRHAISVSFW